MMIYPVITSPPIALYPRVGTPTSFTPWWLRPGGYALVATPWWLRPGGYALVATPWWLRPGGYALVATPGGRLPATPLRPRPIIQARPYLVGANR
jgi:hypothetical protein